PSTGAKTAQRDGDDPIATHPFRPQRQSHLCGMLKIERDLRRRGIATFGIDLETMQNDLLQPRRNTRVPGVGRERVAPKPPPPFGRALRFAERALAGGEEI